MPAIDLDKIRGSTKGLLAGFTTGQKIMTVLAIVGIALGAFYFSQWASAPNYTLLYSSLEPSDASSIVDQLETQGIPYELENGGTTIMVPRDQVYNARIDLSAQGLPAGGSEGYSLLDDQGITTSDFRQRVDYQRAVQGELQRTIEAMDGVASASVMITVPESDVFSGDSEHASASVLVTESGGETLGASQTQAIVHLVANSVVGLTPENITVANAAGTVLSIDGGAGSASLDESVSQEKSWEAHAAADIEELLIPVAGPGNSVVKVNADLDFDQRESTSETYELAPPPAGQTETPALEQSQTSETYTGGGGATPGGVLPEGEVGGATGGDINYSKTEDTTVQPYGKITETVKNAPGTVNRMSVAVLLDSDAVAQGDANQIQTMVETAAGIDGARGDSVEITLLPFDTEAVEAAEAEAAAAASATTQQSLFSIAQTVIALLLVGVVLFFAYRAMKKGAEKQPTMRVPLDLKGLDLGGGAGFDVRNLERLAQSGGGKNVQYDEYEVPQIEIEGPSLADELEGSDQARMQEELNDLIDRQPDEVAMTLRGWLADRRQ